MRWRIDFRDHGAHLFLMQQSGKRLTILVTNEEVIAINDFRFKNRMRNRSDGFARPEAGTEKGRAKTQSKITLTTCA